MKTLFLLMAFFSFGLIQPRLALAADPALTESDREFQLELERVDMRDLEGQANVAQDEAQHQEQLERRHKEDLKELQAQKLRLSKKAKRMIASAEFRRTKAEKAVAQYDGEIARLQKQINELREEMSQTEAQAEEAEGLAAEERAELKQFRQERRELIKRLHQKRAPASASKFKDPDIEAYHDADVQGDEF